MRNSSAISHSKPVRAINKQSSPRLQGGWHDGWRSAVVECVALFTAPTNGRRYCISGIM